ncbi:MAG: Asp-tRNA(Asn)/Glu-tRNA(Gln) amidotransferase subunit GatA [candidate division GAL15 bacterium]
MGHGAGRGLGGGSAGPGHLHGHTGLRARLPRLRRARKACVPGGLGLRTDHVRWPFFEEHHQQLARRLAEWVAGRLRWEEPEDLEAERRRLLGELARGGWLRYAVAGQEHGGVQNGLDVRALCLIREVLSYHEGLADFVFALQGLGSGPISLFGTPEQRRRYLPAVAAGEAVATLGSDTGGSIRQPAALCGVVGLKPTYGRVSRYGLVAFASSLDQVGPLTLDVRDCALILQVISGKDPHDSTSVDLPVPDFVASLEGEVRGLRVGLPVEFFGDGLQPEVREAVRNAVRVLEGLGAVVEEVALPTLEVALPTYYLIACAEASSNLARYDGVAYGYRSPHAQDLYTLYARTRAEGFGPEVKRRVMLGTFALSAGYYEGFYKKAQQVRTLVRRDFDRCFQRVDLLATPTSPVAGFRLGERTADPLQMYLADVYTIPVNLAGLPAISVPCGFANGLPVGLQLVGRPFDEATVLRAAYAYEQSTDWHRHRCPLLRGEGPVRETGP